MHLYSILVISIYNIILRMAVWIMDAFHGVRLKRAWRIFGQWFDSAVGQG